MISDSVYGRKRVAAATPEPSQTLTTFLTRSSIQRPRLVIESLDEMTGIVVRILGFPGGQMFSYLGHLEKKRPLVDPKSFTNTAAKYFRLIFPSHCRDDILDFLVGSAHVSFSARIRGNVQNAASRIFTNGRAVSTVARMGESRLSTEELE